MDNIINFKDIAILNSNHVTLWSRDHPILIFSRKIDQVKYNVQCLKVSNG